VSSANDPHAGQPVLQRGPEPSDARLAIICLHGRGGSPEDILGLAPELGLADVLYLAPTAAGQTWYPHSFLSPIDQNEPSLSSALALVTTLVETLRERGLQPDRIGLLGFSQGACLALETSARAAQRYAAVVGLSGGLIGPPGTARDYPGTFDGTPVFLGCSDVDPHIPVARVRETGEVFRRMGARVDERIYPQMGHTVTRDEVDAVRAILSAG
jgi:predicted esterase